ncbi:pyridoxamine 5'-phosphate oxidase family protein [uncultured Lamprocystis sp.]|jgi:uncharacterized protein YhbP (UPF0306 family)|uniref:pyridoxamine 5'-phosphate oxidase family protein n=1 Tax=uncultured Lamprocystis sp. TaxID=543132 RepID=UPI0025F6C3DE|nr:pyridoxamine 5'-phosphate oxidase family protein [uncultured Lamprocystis sp.]
MTPDAFAAAARRLFDEVAVMTLATCADAVPWATDVYFAPDGFDLVFLSSPRSRHSRNLAVNPACAATIHPPVTSWREIRGLQMEGEVRPPAGTVAKARALAAYLTKFPFARDLIAHPAETAGAFAGATLLVLRPSRLRYLDNGLGIGTRWSQRLVDGQAVGPPELEARE